MPKYRLEIDPFDQFRITDATNATGRPEVAAGCAVPPDELLRLVQQASAQELQREPHLKLQWAVHCVLHRPVERALQPTRSCP